MIEIALLTILIVACSFSIIRNQHNQAMRKLNPEYCQNAATNWEVLRWRFGRWL